MTDKCIRITLQESHFEQAIHAISELSEALSFSIFDATPQGEKARNEFFATDYDIVAGAVRCIYALSEIVSAGLANDELHISG